MQKLHPNSIWLFFFIFLGCNYREYTPVVPVLAYSMLLLYIMTGTSWVKVVIIYGLFAIFCYIWARLTYHYWGYEVTANGIKIEKGIIRKNSVSIPYQKIQNVDIHRGLLNRILNLSELCIQTAGSVGGTGHLLHYGPPRSEGYLPGLSPQDAESLREVLMSRAKGDK